MLNYLWSFLIVISIFFGIFTNKIESTASAILTGCKISVEFLISIVGIFHSFIILPIILTYINISNNNDNERISKFKEQVLVEDDDE